MFGFFRKEKWGHVKTITVDNIEYGNNREKDHGKIFIQLYESDKGNRKIDASCTIKDVSQVQVDNYVRRTELYQTKLLRWIDGRYDPEIPRYSQLAEEDTANALRGKID